MARRVKVRKGKSETSARNAGKVLKSQDYTRRALAAFRSGDRTESLKLAEKALRADPGRFEALNLAGMIETQIGDPTRAVRRLEKARSLAPGYPEVAENLAAAYCAVRKTRNAADIYKSVLETWPERTGAWCNLGNLLNELGETDEARSAYERALDLKPDFLPALVNLALIEGQLGNVKKATELFRECLRLAPDNGEIHHDFSRLKRFAPGDPDIATMESGLQRSGQGTLDRMFYDFALAKAYEDSGDYDRAFDRLAEGNALKRQTVSYEPQEQGRRIEKIIETFSQEFLARRVDNGFPSEKPIFIFGMPRSGTSLAEQILASHSAVAGAGELALLTDTITNGAGAPNSRAQQKEHTFPDDIGTLPKATLADLGQAYVDGLPEKLKGNDRITDKMPGNYLYAGMVRLILPQAKMIHCRRSPLDTCFSCFSIFFPFGQAFSYDLEDLGRHYRAYHRLMGHWSAVLGDAILDVEYEDLVANPEVGARKIVEFCGLPWEDACVNFHETRRQVRTASSMQVRQPIYKTAVRRWKRFEHRLDPLIGALGDLADLE